MAGKFYKTRVKRILDVLLAATLSVPAFVVVLIAYVAIKMEDRGPAFFLQQRPGIHAKPFRLYKLRTMTSETGQNVKMISDMERMTKVGRVLRALSIDELPQLLNILKGDMSFIGPRPLLMQYVPLYSPEQMRRHEVRPGISGWAQVNGRNELGWEDKFRMDVWYVDHISFSLDAAILGRTIVKVVRRDGINSGSKDTMPLFTGSEGKVENV